VTSRYGRNKRRADRERIAWLEKNASLLDEKLQAEVRHHRHTRHQLYNAREIALTEAANKDEKIKYAMSVIAHELARQLGPELAQPAQRLLESDRRGRRQPIWDVRVDDRVSGTMEVVRGRIELDYNFVLGSLR
jgi:hypothetical protein